MTYYRLHDYAVSNGVDQFDNPIPGLPRINVTTQEFKVVKHTPKGVWIESYGMPRFVLDGSRKRYACPTLQEAKESFQARKKTQIRILKAQLNRAQRALELSERINESNLTTERWW